MGKDHFMNTALFPFRWSWGERKKHMVPKMAASLGGEENERDMNEKEDK